MMNFPGKPLHRDAPGAMQINALIDQVFRQGSVTADRPLKVNWNGSGLHFSFDKNILESYPQVTDALNGDQANYYLDNTSWLQVNAQTSLKISGFQNGTGQGRLLVVTNVGAAGNNLTLTHLDPASLPENRIYLPQAPQAATQLVLVGGGNNSAILQYEPVNQYWIVLTAVPTTSGPTIPLGPPLPPGGPIGVPAGPPYLPIPVPIGEPNPPVPPITLPNFPPTGSPGGPTAGTICSTPQAPAMSGVAINPTLFSIAAPALFYSDFVVWSPLAYFATTDFVVWANQVLISAVQTSFAGPVVFYGDIAAACQACFASTVSIGGALYLNGVSAKIDTSGALNVGTKVPVYVVAGGILNSIKVNQDPCDLGGQLILVKNAGPGALRIPKSGSILSPGVWDYFVDVDGGVLIWYDITVGAWTVLIDAGGFTGTVARPVAFDDVACEFICEPESYINGRLQLPQGCDISTPPSNPKNPPGPPGGGGCCPGSVLWTLNNPAAAPIFSCEMVLGAGNLDPNTGGAPCIWTSPPGIDFSSIEPPNGLPAGYELTSIQLVVKQTGVGAFSWQFAGVYANPTPTGLGNPPLLAWLWGGNFLAAEGQTCIPPGSYAPQLMDTVWQNFVNGNWGTSTFTAV